MSRDEGGGLYEEVRARLPEDMHEEYAAYLEDYFDYKNIFTRSEADLVASHEGFSRYFATAIGATPLPELPEQGEGGGWMVHAMYFGMGLQHDYRDALKDVGAPVLVIHGADDLQAEPVSHTYVDAFPNARFTVIEDVGHVSIVDHAARFGSVVSDFLSELR
jgi:pimeloyl-ACP methyl ester carboxylesterase